MPAEEPIPNNFLIPWESSRQSRGLVSARKPPNLPALCLYLPKFIYLAQLLKSTIYPKGEVEAPASGKEFCIFPFLISAQELYCQVCALDSVSSPVTQVRPIPTPKVPNHCTYTAWGSLNLPTCWIWYIKSPPFTYSITKYKRS